MRTQVQLFIALSLFACFTAAASPNCSTLVNDKVLCQAANSLCTWTDVATSNTCIDTCTAGFTSQTECTKITGCGFTASTCTAKDTCTAHTTGADCTQANNCKFTATQCNAVTAGMNCNDANGNCLANQPDYCTKTTTSGCAASAAPTSTCAQGNTASGQCTAPCTTETPSTTCTTSVCSGLLQTACEANATNCSWAGNTCSLLTTLTDCATVAPASCATNTQCKSVTVYNCSSTQASINAFCGTNPAGTVCGATLTGWCTSTTTNTCAINNAYCVLGTTCQTDTTFCSITGTCAVDDANACTRSDANPTCNQTLCTGKYSSCATAAANGCQVNGTACTPADDSCLFNAGGTCTVNPSGTNGYIIAFCASILAFVFAF